MSVYICWLSFPNDNDLEDEILGVYQSEETAIGSVINHIVSVHIKPKITITSDEFEKQPNLWVKEISFKVNENDNFIYSVDEYIVKG